MSLFFASERLKTFFCTFGMSKYIYEYENRVKNLIKPFKF